jgi:hypothetical protein
MNLYINELAHLPSSSSQNKTCSRMIGNNCFNFKMRFSKGQVHNGVELYNMRPSIDAEVLILVSTITNVASPEHKYYLCRAGIWIGSYSVDLMSSSCPVPHRFLLRLISGNLIRRVDAILISQFKPLQCFRGVHFIDIFD